MLSRFIFALFLSVVAASSQTIQTVVGGGPVNASALDVGLDGLSGLAVDSSGNVYVAVYRQHQIWKISSAGNVTRYAGTGSSNFSGDGGPALLAGLAGPGPLAIDKSGNLFTLDDHRVRRISASGIITTVAGNGGNANTGDGGLATAAAIGHAYLLAVDDRGDLLIGTYSISGIYHTFFHAVRMVNPAGVISTVAGVLDSPGDTSEGTSALSAREYGRTGLPRIRPTRCFLPTDIAIVFESSFRVGISTR